MAYDEDGGFEDQGVFEAAKQTARDTLQGKSLRELCQLQVEYKDKKEALSGELKIVNAYFDVLRFELIPNQAELDGVDSVKYEDIGRMSLTGDALVSVKGGMKEALYDWLRSNGLGDLIQPVVNASTLKAFVKGRIKKALPYPTDCLNVTPITRASITVLGPKKV